MPRLLDLFCGAGGAAMGYHRAGFDVTGVDIKPQPRFPFEFIQADALTFPLDGFDGIHASPPCQGYSRMRHLPWLKDNIYPMLLDHTRDRLQSQSAPWAIENVEDAPMPYSVILCGRMFDLPLYRHRRFGLSHLVMQLEHRSHTKVIVSGRATMATKYKGHGVAGVLSGTAQNALGIDWMTKAELAQAIPPAYTEWIGQHLLRAIHAQAVA